MPMLPALLMVVAGSTPPDAERVQASRQALASLKKGPPVASLEAELKTLHAMLEPFGLERAQSGEAPQRDWSFPEPEVRSRVTVPPAQAAAIRARLTALEKQLRAAQEPCSQAYDGLNSRGMIAMSTEDLRAACPLSEPQCKPILEIEAAQQWARDCNELVSESADASRAVTEWLGAVATRREADAADTAYLRPVSGPPGARALEHMPPTFARPNADPSLAEVMGSTYDTLGLFAAAHPSRFVFLRRDMAKGRPINPDQNEWSLFRMLHKGEAMLLLGGTSSRSIVVSIDGIHSYVKVEDLAGAPIPGTKPGSLTAAELNLFDDSGHIVAGPRSMAVETNGFSMEETPRFLEWLDPPEPRQQQFFDARSKVVDCYTKKLKEMDPTGQLRRHFDVIRTNRRTGEVVTLETAEAALDRKACAVCGCKAFNGTKAKFAKQAVVPRQLKAFEAYKAVLDRLNSTDFAEAARQGPATAAPEEPHGI